MNGYPDLVALLRGELSNADVTEVAGHLDRCDECRRGLVETAAGGPLPGRGRQPGARRRGPWSLGHLGAAGDVPLKRLLGLTYERLFVNNGS